MKGVVWAAALRAPLLSAFIVCVCNGMAFAQTVPSPWTARDVGAPTLRGSAAHSSGVFTISGAGSDIGATSDQFMFVYQQVSGDVEVIARIDDLDGSSGYAKAGVMIRASLSSNAAHAYAHATVGAGVRALRRLATGATTLARTGTSSPAPIWVRAMRKGTQVTTSWSSSGSSWSTMSTDTIALGTSAYVGIAVNSRNSGARATARVSNVRVNRQGLPAGQQNADIGGPDIAGSTAYTAGKYTIKAAGRDIWDTADEFHYVYQPVTGNVDVIARVVSITNTRDWAKAGVMIRESLSASSRHAMTVISVSKGNAFQRRPETGAYSEHTSGGTGTAPGWVRLVRTGDLFEAYRSTTGTSWTRIGSDTIPMGDTVYVGIAASSVNSTLATTAVVDSFKVTSSAPSGNRSPAVTVTSPANGTKVTAPATVTIAATASDPENRMASVDFYVGSTMVARDTTAPYSTGWAASTAGTYSLTAVAHDADGGSSTSAAVSLTVATSTTGPPTKVAFTASSDHATNVTRYVLKVFRSGVSPTTGTPVATSDLGKPTPSSTREIIVDRASFFSALAVGSYVATVTAVGPNGQTQSTAAAFTR